MLDRVADGLKSVVVGAVLAVGGFIGWLVQILTTGVTGVYLSGVVFSTR